MASTEQNTQQINELTEAFNELVENSKNIEDLTGASDPIDADSIFMIRFDNGGSYATFKVTVQQILDLIATGAIDFTIYAPQSPAPSYQEGLLYYDNVWHSLVFYNDEADVALNIGEENWIRVKNNTGGDILNGKVCYLNGVDGSIPTCALAKADEAVTSVATIGVATHTIEDGTEGYITRLGTVRDVDTSTFVAGDIIYLSADTAGEFTDVQPQSPDYTVRLGVFSEIGVSGKLEIHVSVGGNVGNVIKVFNGATLETTDVSVASDGVDITLTLDDVPAQGFLSLFFDADFFRFPTPDTIDLTLGTDEVPIKNYVYIPNSTKVLTVSTSAFPTNEQFVPVATVVCQDAPGAQNDGVRSFQVWTDHLSNAVDQGHYYDINAWIRAQPATYINGIAFSSDPAIGVSAAEVNFAVTQGDIQQLHVHTYPAKDTDTGSIFYIVNDFEDPYLRITTGLDSGDFDTDSTGAAMSAYYRLVLWGTISETSGDSQWYINKPSGSYNNSTDALNDISNTQDSSIPSEYKGVGFLMYALVCRNQGGNIEIITDGLIDLREAAGGAGGTGGVGIDTYLELSDTPTTRAGEVGKLVAVASGEAADEYSDVTVQDVTINKNYVETNLATDSLIRGSASWDSLLIFLVTPCDYIINGVLYHSDADSVTLDAADGTHPRIDLIVVDTSLNVTFVKGTATTPPVAPEIDTDTQITVTSITIQAAATTPDGVTSVVQYDEDTGDPPEWDATENTATVRIVLDSTNDPYSGTKSIEATLSINNDEINLDIGVPVSTSVISNLQLFLKSKAVWPSTKRLEWTWYSGNTRASRRINIRDDSAYNFDSSQTSTYQAISIPEADWNFSESTVDNLKIKTKGSGAGIGFFLDLINYQGGIGNIIIQGMTAVQDDKNPVLGGDLDGDGHDITNVDTLDVNVMATSQATPAEITSQGDDALITVEFANENYMFEDLGYAFGSETDDMTTGSAKVSFHMPFAMTLTDVIVDVVTAPTGSTAIFDLNEAGASVLSTKISIDISEKTSGTAATPPVISDSALAVNALMTVDIDQIGSTIAGAGPKIYLIGDRV